MKSYRQGDVLLVEVAEVPMLATPVRPDARGVVLMEGELTGHHHRFADIDNVTRLEMTTGEGYVTLERPDALKHEEHTAIMFTGKKYQQGYQVEDYGEELRQVAD